MRLSYREPNCLDEVLALVEEHGASATLLAGGVTFTSMMRECRLHSDSPRLVVSLGKVAELRGIRAQSDGLWIGAMTTQREIELSPTVRVNHRVLAETVAQIGSVRIRNQATLGGNLACRNPAFDPAVALIALDAVAVIATPDASRREIPMDRLVNDRDGHSLRAAQVIVGVRVPEIFSQARALYIKVRSGSAAASPIVSVAALLQLAADGRVADVRLAVGAAGRTVFRARRTERALRGSWPTPDAIHDVSAFVAEDIDPVDDSRGSVRYKRRISRIWAARALATLATSDARARSGSRIGVP